ncbi:MAG: hypothetical protein JXA91_08620 [Candidatus Thermoplasmatota archaeon]|nr:hypothetical protein [Candidatus Thermoplasmatota archaeon]
MKEECGEYEEYVKKRWRFSNKLAKELVDNEQLQSTLSIEIFSKSCSPFHYFQAKDESTSQEKDPPTEKQISFAKQLGILNPEMFSKQQLSVEIDKAVKENKDKPIEKMKP